MFIAGDISVVIPSYNSQDTIAYCLISLLGQTTPPGEIIVVDSSEDDTAELVRTRFPGVRIFKAKHRIFPGPARNRGVRMARGSIVAFIDSDCVAASDWVQRLVVGHNGGSLAVGGAVELGNPFNAVAWAGHLCEFREFLPFGNPLYVPHIPTCNVSYQKQVLETYGGFPDAYYPQEDLLFNYLLNQNGIRIWFDPRIRVRHYYRDTLRQFLSHQHRIGRVTRSTLRRVNLAGSGVARRSWLAFAAAPFLGLVKWARTVSAFLRHYPRQALRMPALPFLLLLGSLWWARGFAAGARKGLSGVAGIHDPEEPIFLSLSPLTADETAEPGVADP
jgi:glycosyltransferase involved in cell wall biosynthesis